MTAHVVTEVADGVMTVTFNRPEKKNAITGAMYQQMAEALDAAKADLAVRAVLILGGDGRPFRDQQIARGRHGEPDRDDDVRHDVRHDQRHHDDLD